MCARSLEARGEIANLAQVLKRAPWQVRNLPGWARKFSYAQLSQAFRLCANAERDLKMELIQTLHLCNLLANYVGKCITTQ